MKMMCPHHKALVIFEYGQVCPHPGCGYEGILIPDGKEAIDVLIERWQKDAES